MREFFVNYQITKLNISSPDFVNLLIIIFFFVGCFVFVEQSNVREDLLSKVQTQQLKGLAIFFVVLGHLWVHVAQYKPSFIFSGDAVSLFLFLSGFGLMRSNIRNRISFRSFFTKRIDKIYKTYWLITIVIVILDYLILSKCYNLKALFLTFVGLNVSPELRHMDYVRWFITFLLMWYILFFVINLFVKPRISSLLLLMISGVMLPVHYYFFDFGWYQFLSFPIGSIIAVYYEPISRITEKRKGPLIFSFFLVVYVLFYYHFMSNQTIYTFVYEHIPNILLEYYNEMISIFLTIAVIIILGEFGRAKFRSALLLLLGKYSYEIFLLHGIFLIKYNPIIRDTHPLLVVIEFFVFVILISLFSALLSITIRSKNKKLPSHL